MTNPYYTVTGIPVALSRGTSSQVRAEYTLIQTGFDAVNVQMLLRGSIAGQVWTGTHDYTAATVSFGAITVSTKAASDNSTNAASTAFVQTLVASSLTGASAYSAVATYAYGAQAFSLVNGATFRNMTGVNSGLDPTLDPANWKSIAPSSSGGDLYLANSFGAL